MILFYFFQFCRLFTFFLVSMSENWCNFFNLLSFSFKNRLFLSGFSFFCGWRNRLMQQQNKNKWKLRKTKFWHQFVISRIIKMERVLFIERFIPRICLHPSHAYAERSLLACLLLYIYDRLWINILFIISISFIFAFERRKNSVEVCVWMPRMFELKNSKKSFNSL